MNNLRRSRGIERQPVVCVLYFHSVLLVTVIYTQRDPLPLYTQSLTEEHITETDRHRLRLDVVVQRRLTQLTADTRLLVATEWQLPVKSVVRVDPDSSCTERVGDLDGRIEVGGVEGGGKTVGG
jgi:hypothetical protein